MADLTTTLAATIAAAIGAASPSGTTQNIWTAHDSSGATWNASNVFLSGMLNKSCIAFKQDPANTFAAHMTVISAHHAICAAHVAPAVGTTVYAYKEDGTVVSTTVASPVDQIPGTDICVLTFAAALTGVQVARFLPDTFEQYIHKTNGKVYGIFLTQDEKTFVGYTTGSLLAIYGSFFAFTEDAADPYYTWFQTQRNGDSSSPFFYLIGGYLVVEESAYGVGFGAAYDDWVSAIQSIMTTRTGETLTYIDLSGYATVSDPAVYSAPSPPPLNPGLAVADLIVDGFINKAGTATPRNPYDYTDLVAATTYGSVAAVNRRVLVRGGFDYMDGSTLMPPTPGNYATGCTLEILPTTDAYTGHVSAVPQTVVGGVPYLTGPVAFTGATVGLSAISFHGFQIGNTDTYAGSGSPNADAYGTSSGGISITSIGKTSSAVYNNLMTFSASDSLILNPTAATNSGVVKAINVGDGANVIFNNVGIWDNTGTLSAGKTIFQVATVGSGSANITVSHMSSHHTHNASGWGRISLTANMILTLNLTNNITLSGTDSTYKSWFTLSLASGAATLILNGSGVRTGIWNATAVKAAGITLIDNTTDIVQGLTSATMFADTTSGLTILTNASTLVTATTSPVAMDINGANRPQIMPWDGSARVYAGAVNANISVGGLNATASAVVTWTAFAGANHYTASVNGVSAGTLASGGTVGFSARQTATIQIAAIDASGTTLGIGNGALCIVPNITNPLSIML